MTPVIGRPGAAVLGRGHVTRRRSVERPPWRPPAQYTDKQKAAFRAKFREKQRYQVAAFVPLVGAAFLLAASVGHAPELAHEAGTIALAIAGLVLTAAAFSWWNWRCPACAKPLGTRLRLSRCPKCGVALSSP